MLGCPMDSTDYDFGNRKKIVAGSLEMLLARRLFSSGSSKIMTVTPAAVKRLQDLISQKSDPNILGIRVSLARKGCENLSYTMNYTDKQEKLDEVVVADDIKVFVDSKAVMYLIGTEMDYVSNDLMQEFVFYVCNFLT
jgi:iron-sulfur cluster assembly accessory protein